MSMYTALSGINAAQADIAATSHNIANVSTNGFKASRVEFADIFSSSPLSVARTAVGSGAQVARTQQSFTQGNVAATGNVLDLAIEGPGFFAIRTQSGNTAETQFTRSGAFSRDVDGTIVNAAGAALLGWPAAQDGTPLSNDPGDGFPLRIPPTLGGAKATTEMSIGLTLPTRDTMLGEQDAVPPTDAFDIDDPTTYAFSTPLTVTDENGKPMNARAYLVKTDSADTVNTTSTWAIHITVDGAEMPATTARTFSFEESGEAVTPATVTFDLFGTAVEVDLAESTMADEAFTVETAEQNGKVPASLYAVEIDASGTVFASYSSGESVAMGKIFLANFANPQGLRQMGATALSATATSGAPLLGSPGETGFGLMRSGALERSNVDLTQELVNLISAQRNYQASAKAMETSSSLSQTIINMRT